MRDERTTEKASRRGCWVLAGFVLLAILVGVGPYLFSGARVSMRLPVGTLVTIEDVTYGTNHTFHPDPSWKRNLRPHLGSWTSWLGPEGKPRVITTEIPTPIMWARVEAAEGGEANWEKAMLISETGQELDLPSSYYSVQDDHNIYPLFLHSAPRRAPFFIVSQRATPEQLRLKIPNPLFGRTWPVWKPDPLPITNRVGSVDFVLRDAVIRQDGSRSQLVSELETYSDGQRRTNWHVHTELLSDATGNRWFMIPTNEPAWRITMTVRKTKQALWNSTNKSTIGVHRLPTAGRVDWTPIGKTLVGIQLKGLLVGGQGSHTIHDGKVTQSLARANQPRLLLQDSTPTSWKAVVDADGPWLAILCDASSTHTTLIDLHDGEGESIETDHIVTHHTPSHAMHLFTMPGLVNRPLSLRLTFHVQKPLQLEFIVDPATLRRTRVPDRK